MTIRAIYERGMLKLSRRLKLKEHQPVLVDIHLLPDDVSSSSIARLARKAKSFSFLENSAEDVYSRKDGKPIAK